MSNTTKVKLTYTIPGATYPALAILFSRTMKAFETIDVSEANFFSLMFFVVALANFVIYAVAGWICNEIGQVSPIRYQFSIFEVNKF